MISEILLNGHMARVIKGVEIYDSLAVGYHPSVIVKRITLIRRSYTKSMIGSYDPWYG